MFGSSTNNLYHWSTPGGISAALQESARSGHHVFRRHLMLMFSFNQLIGPGSVAIISRRYGEKQYDLTRRPSKRPIVLKLFFSIPFRVCGIRVCEELLRLVGADW